MKVIWITAFLMLSVTCARAQFTVRGEEPAEKHSVFFPKIVKSPKIKGNIKVASTRNEFLEKRIEERRKIAEDMKKPQYSDKMYFGHKKKPKKRLPGKRKLCGECGIVH